jgi:DNA-binding response OmpR family regulator
MSKDKYRILLAEDDTNLGDVLKDYLEMEGFEVNLCRDGEESIQVFKTYSFDICLLDVMMPKKDGFTLAKEIRQQNTDIPIIFLTAKSMKEDKIAGFRLGGDDYITKPFDEEELVYRIHAVLKRTPEHQDKYNKNIFKIGAYNFDYSKQILELDGENRRLTGREADILRLLCLQENQILKREDALKSIWGENDYFHGRSFDVFITKLRKYLKDDPNIKIENVHGVGFILNHN